MRFTKRYMRLKTAITLFVCTVVFLSLSVTGILIGIKEANRTQADLSEKAMTIARMVANTPLVIEALEGKRNRADVELFADTIRRATGVRFIVVMDMNHIRLSHPDKDRIGQRFVGGDENRAMHGQEYVSIAKGTLGTSLRAFVPIQTAAGKEVGVVAVGIMLNHVHEAVAQSEYIIYTGIGVGILIGILGALVLARRIKSILFDLEPHEIANLLQERNAMLESVREGILAVNRDCNIVVANAEAVRIYRRAGIEGDPIGKNAQHFLPTSHLAKVLQSGIREFDQEQELNGITIVINRVPVMVGNQVVGAIATFRDKTEIKHMAEQLTGVKLYAEALRVQAHEFMNKLHVILGMVHMGRYEKLSKYILQVTNHYQMEVGSVSRLVRDPVLAGFLLGKLSYAREKHVTLTLQGDSPLPSPKEPEVTDAIITVLGNLIDNAIEAVENCEQKEVHVSMTYDESVFSFSVADSGNGIPEELRETIFSKGFSTKGDNRGYGLFLTREQVEKLGGKLRMISGNNGTKFTVELPYEEGETT